MHALALTHASDRATLERLAGERASGERAGAERAAGARAGRIEIIAPSREDARAGARRYEEAAGRAASVDSWREARSARRMPEPSMSMRFVAQFVAQQQPGNAAHVENWRGARAAYASAADLGAGRGAALSILI